MFAGNRQHEVVESHVRVVEGCCEDCDCSTGSNYLIKDEIKIPLSKIQCNGLSL